ncbi:MAG: ribulose-phosphate 3-epimerase [Anaerolineales bacterium]
MIKIAPSILAADMAALGVAVAEAEAAGADMIHVDVMDGRFVPNLTFGPVVVAAVRDVTSLPLDVHLMIETPERYLTAFAEAGADYLTVHPETCPHLHRTLQQISDLNVGAGVALNPATSEETLRYVVSMLDLVLVMSVNPGFGGQAFLPEVLPKIKAVRRMVMEAEREALISVDGGIDVETAPLVVAAGAELLIAGSAIFKAEVGVAAAITAIREAV